MPYLFDRHSVREETEAIARGALGDEAYERATRDGGAMPHREAVQQQTPSRKTRGGEGRSGIGPLTPSEVKVARLVANGLSNREIAAELVLSPRTVEAHVQHILTKLGYHSRAQIASWMTRAEEVANRA